MSVGHTVLRGSPTVSYRRNLFSFTIHEEEQLVFDNRATQRKTVGSLAIFLAGTGYLESFDSIASHVLISVINVRAALESIGTRRGSGIHTTADEVGLTHVVGSNYHLQLFNSFDGDGVATTGKSRWQTKVVVEVGTIHGEVGRTTIRSDKAHAIASIRRKTRDVGDAAAHRRQIHHLRIVDVGWGTGLLLRKLGCRCTDNNLTQHGGVFRKGDTKVIHLTQLKRDILVSLRLVSHIAHRNGIRTTCTHTLNVKTSVHVGHCRIGSSRRLVYRLDGRTNEFFAGSLKGNLTTHCGSCNLCHHWCAQTHHHGHQKNNFFLHFCVNF